MFSQWGISLVVFTNTLVNFEFQKSWEDHGKALEFSFPAYV